MTRYKQFYSNFKSFLIEREIEQKNDIIGCSEKNIEQLEKQFGQLPLAYKEYLLAIGKKHLTTLFDCDDYSIDNLEYAHEIADEILKEDNYTINTPYIVLSEHHGYNFTYIHINEHNPPVYLYMEGDKCPTLISNTFTSWIKESAIQTIEFKIRNNEVSKEIAKNRTNWIERKQILDSYREEAEALRKSFIAKIEQEELNYGYFKSIEDVQTEWINYFQETDLAKTLQKEDIRIPWGWIDLKHQSINSQQKQKSKNGFWKKLKSFINWK